MLKALFFAASTLLAATPAVACDCISLIPSNPRFNSDLDRIAQFYPVAAEGVLEADGPYAWRFRPSREYRGPRQPSYRIELVSDCSLGPDEMRALLGKPVFLLLSGGRERYEASRCVNLQNSEVEAAIRARIQESCAPR